MKDDIDKHGIIVKVFNRVNQFKTSFEKNINSYFNELINFSKSFVTRIVRDRPGFFNEIMRLNIMIYPHFTPKETYKSPYCGIMGV